MPVSLQFSDVLLEKNDDNAALKRELNKVKQELNQLRAVVARTVNQSAHHLACTPHS